MLFIWCLFCVREENWASALLHEESSLYGIFLLALFLEPPPEPHPAHFTTKPSTMMVTHHLEHTCDWKFLAPSESLPVLNSRSTSPNIIFSTTKESGNNFYSINRLSNVINVNLECTIDTHLNIFPGSSPMKWYYPNDIDNIVACFQIYIFGKQA